MEPQGTLTLDHVEIKQNTCAIYWRIFFKDEEGVLWVGRGSSFLFDLQMAAPNEAAAPVE